LNITLIHAFCVAEVWGGRPASAALPAFPYLFLFGPRPLPRPLLPAPARRCRCPGAGAGEAAVGVGTGHSVSFFSILLCLGVARFFMPTTLAPGLCSEDSILPIL
jgi:hypothetical protein